MPSCARTRASSCACSRVGADKARAAVRADARADVRGDGLRPAVRRTAVIAGACSRSWSSPAPPLRRRLTGRRLRRLRHRARRRRLGDRSRDGVGRREVRPGGHGRAAVDARQPAGAVHRHLRAQRGRARRRAVLDPRLAVRERAARARARDRGGRRVGGGRRDALPQAAAERHGDAAAALDLPDRRCSGSPTRSATAPASIRWRSRSSARSACSSSTAPGSYGYLRADTRGRARGTRSTTHDGAAVPVRARAARGRRASRRRSSPSGSSTRSTRAVEKLGISKAFTGLVIVAIAGNAVENVVAVQLARKGKSDLALSVVKNSVAQIACFLFPALVLVSLLFERAAHVRDQPRLHRRARPDGDRGLADHRRRRGGPVRGAGPRRASTSCSRRSSGSSRPAAAQQALDGRRAVPYEPDRAGGAPPPRRASAAAMRPARARRRRARRTPCAAGAGPGCPTASHIRRTCRLRPSWSTSSTRERPSCRARAGAVTPSSSSTPSASARHGRRASGRPRRPRRRSSRRRSAGARAGGRDRRRS